MYLPDLITQRRKTNNKPRDASNPTGDTAADSLRHLVKKNPKFSRRLNYDHLKELIDGGHSPSISNTAIDDDKDEADLFTMDDDKSDGEGVINPAMIVEEEPGTVVSRAPTESTTRRKNPSLPPEDVDIDDEGSEEEKDDDLLGWEDAYEQEV